MDVISELSQWCCGEEKIVWLGLVTCTMTNFAGVFIGYLARLNRGLPILDFMKLIKITTRRNETLNLIGNMGVSFFVVPLLYKPMDLSGAFIAGLAGGRYTEALLRKTKDYKLAFTVEKVVNTRDSNPFELGRLEPMSTDTPVTLIDELERMRTRI